MEALLNSFLLVFVSEMGDKTQLLALVLTTRFGKPWSILAGVLVATVLNHLLASWLGGHLATLVSAEKLKWILAATFFAFALWILVPDKESAPKESGRFGAFLTTVISFFLAEMGDKTQLATLALGARYANTTLVTFGTTMGMLAADSLAIFLGHKLLVHISMKWIRYIASFLFFLFGLLILWR